MKKRYFLIVGVLLILLGGGYFMISKSDEFNELDTKFEKTIKNEGISPIVNEKNLIAKSSVEENSLYNYSYYIDNVNDNYFVLVSDKNPNSESEKGVYKNGKWFDFLNKEETVIGISNNYLYSENISSNDNHLEINKYKVLQNELIKKNSLKLTKGLINLKLIDDLLIISDDVEGYGTKIDFYDENLKLLFTYFPNKNGFYSYQLVTNKETVKILVNPYLENDSHKISILNLSSKEIISEMVLELPVYNIKKVYGLTDGLTIYGIGTENKRYLMKLNNLNEIVWVKEITLPLFHRDIGVFQSNIKDEIYVIDEEAKISILNIDTGETKKTINLKKIIGKENIKIADIKLINNNIFVLTGTVIWDKKNINSIHYESNTLFKINLENHFIYQQKIDDQLKKPKILIENDRISINTLTGTKQYNLNLK